jgi:hypothetical protein
MKLTILSILFFSASLTLSAQINKGSLFLGADLSFSGAKVTNEANTYPYFNKSNNISIAVSAGKATKENLLFGVRILYSSGTNQQDTPYYKNTSRAAGGGIWARKYYTLSKNFYLFLDGSMNVQGTSAEQTPIPQNGYYKYNGLYASLAVYPGISYQVQKSFFLDLAISNLASLNYSNTKQEWLDSQNKTYSYNSTSYGISTSVASSNPLQIGARWVIAKK